jgi:hypothetical protein
MLSWDIMVIGNDVGRKERVNDSGVSYVAPRGVPTAQERRYLSCLTAMYSTLEKNDLILDAGNVLAGDRQQDDVEATQQ